MKIPYGISNFRDIRTEGYFYVDKTHFLAQLEQIGPRYLVFLRPRRFGKSLFLSLLEHYYDIRRVDEFDELFRGLWIHENPTPEKNRYLVLTFDFSQVATDSGPIPLRRTFFEATKNSIRKFLLWYGELVPEFAGFVANIDAYEDAEALLGAILGVVAATKYKLYVLIDEYDNFANRLLSDGAQDLYEEIVMRTGFVRTFYAALKAGTGSGAVARMFVTGVSPLLLDDMSSGFNIATNLSMSPRFNAMAGFTHAEVERLLDGFLATRRELADLPEMGDRARMLTMLEQFYDGYRFSPEARERIFNADMVLYFLRELDDLGHFPIDLLDLNVRTDYSRLQRIGLLSGTAMAERRAFLETIASEGGIQSELVRQFGVKSLSSQSKFISLLYYLGMLTLGQQRSDVPIGALGYRLEIPNRVIRELQWEHLAILIKEEAEITIDTREIDAALYAMAIEGEIQPFLDLFHERVVKAVGVKDLRRFDEKSLKLMLLAYISLNRLFHPLSEKEFAQGYCDLFLGVSPLIRAAKFAWLLEIKYLPSGAKGTQVERAFGEAEAQVARYASDERLVPLLTQGQALRAGSLVFVGAQKVLFRAWPPSPKRTAKKKG